MKTHNHSIWLLLTCLTLALHADPAPAVPSLAGTWTFVPERSTDLSPWKTLTISIAVDDHHVEIRRHFANGDRATDSTVALDMDQTVNVVPVPWWMDNRHLGAYIGGDRTEKVRAGWIDDGRILRTDADLILDAQQGPRKVNILTDYKLSPSGAQLTIIELRSTRPIPIVYVLQRSHP